MNGNGAAASYGDLLVTSLFVLVAVSIAAFVVVKVLGRFLATGGVRGAHLLDVVARVPLEPRRSLYVVEVAGKTLLVGTSEMGLSVLSELDGAEVRARVVPKQSFADLVRGALSRRRGGAHVGARHGSDAGVHVDALGASGVEAASATASDSASGTGAASATGSASASASAAGSASGSDAASASDSVSVSASGSDSVSASASASASVSGSDSVSDSASVSDSGPGSGSRAVAK
jgi:flagellar biogenesis protein FliO